MNNGKEIKMIIIYGRPIKGRNKKAEIIAAGPTLKSACSNWLADKPLFDDYVKETGDVPEKRKEW